MKVGLGVSAHLTWQLIAGQPKGIKSIKQGGGKKSFLDFAIGTSELVWLVMLL